MDFALTKEEKEFEKEVADWIKGNIPKRWIERNPKLLWEEDDELWDIAMGFRSSTFETWK
jgi:cytochrome c